MDKRLTRGLSESVWEVYDQVHVGQESKLHNIDHHSRIRLAKGNFWRDYYNR